MLSVNLGVYCSLSSSCTDCRLTAITILKVLPWLASSPVLVFPVKTIFTFPKSLFSVTFIELNNLKIIVPGVFELSVPYAESPSNEPFPSVYILVTPPFSQPDLSVSIVNPKVLFEFAEYVGTSNGLIKLISVSKAFELTLFTVYVAPCWYL